jgi:hypothetical protein
MNNFTIEDLIQTSKRINFSHIMLAYEETAQNIRDYFYLTLTIRCREYIEDFKKV